MRKVLLFILLCFIGNRAVCATVRDGETVYRHTANTVTTPVMRATKTAVSRSTTTQSVRPRSFSIPTVAGTRSSGTMIPRTASVRSTVSRTTTTPTNTSRSDVRNTTARVARSTVNTNDNSQSKTFGTGYNTCRDAYFTCMDQFCAAADDTYRRCICSSRLYEIKSKQNALKQSADEVQYFKDLNIAAIPKTAAEVKAMQTATDGELVASIKKDTSASAAQLAGINAVLSGTKSKSLSTAGTLDIAGDINAIWATTDLASGLNISNLTGETLHSAVHSQCANLVAEKCSSKSLLNMVVSAYTMYIENDCSLLANSLDKQKNTANANIRETEREMNTARLENYDAHNSSSINDCVAMVRDDITADAACGTDYVHCLDTTGLYLNKSTGEPIYTSNFYQLGNLISLSDDLLTNKTNHALVAELNRKRVFASKSLDTCRDLADEVWDEFMRQAITEIYQGQQDRISKVKNECLTVVDQCYDKQSNSLKDFSQTKEQLLLGTRLELSEELCKEKLAACSNLYGGGPGGLEELLTTMSDITTQKIAQNCVTTLTEYVHDLCSVQASDTLHTYPYGCRVYAPGEQMYASDWYCNNYAEVAKTISNTYRSQTSNYVCKAKRIYVSCGPGYELNENQCNFSQNSTQNICGEDYPNSLYKKLVVYAVQACMRPSEANALTADSKLPNSLIQDVNTVMDSVRSDMAASLKTECERQQGYWVAAQWNDADTNETEIDVWRPFYNETGANKKWGYCADPDTVKNYYNGVSAKPEDTEETVEE